MPKKLGLSTAGKAKRPLFSKIPNVGDLGQEPMKDLTVARPPSLDSIHHHQTALFVRHGQHGWSATIRIPGEKVVDVQLQGPFQWPVITLSVAVSCLLVIRKFP